MSYLCFIKKYFINGNNTSNQFINFLTDCPCIQQTKAEKAKSWILAKVGWVDHTKYFCFAKIHDFAFSAFVCGIRGQSVKGNCSFFWLKLAKYTPGNKNSIRFSQAKIRPNGYFY